MQNTYNNEVLAKLYKHIVRAEPPMNKRNEQIYAERTSGKTLQYVGDKYGISRERVRQITARKEEYLSYQYLRLALLDSVDNKEEALILALPFSPRTSRSLVNRIRRMDMTVAEFIDTFTMNDIKTRFPNLGAKSVKDLIDVLEAYIPGITSRIKE